MTSHEFWAIWHMSGKTIESITQEIKDKRTEAQRLALTDHPQAVLLQQWADSLQRYADRYRKETAPPSRMQRAGKWLRKRFAKTI